METYLEIDSTLLDSKTHDVGDIQCEQPLSPYSSDTGGIFGEPQVLPCIGDEYQAKIPPLIPEYDRLQLIEVARNSAVMVHVHYSFPLGLPIPLMWSNNELENINGTVEFESSEGSQMNSDNGYVELKIEPVDTSLSGCQKDMGLHSNLEDKAGGNNMEVDMAILQETNTKMDQVKRGICPLPGYLNESWTDAERDGFLLGLYIFGKNLVHVKRFVESKEMGDILSFYYGKFYRSNEYRRWSESRKQRSKRSVHGQKIFTGWRQQELLSRLSSHVPQECQSMLSEVSRTFCEGNMSFEEYVFTVRDAVGINMLIEAIGIGRGKQDLTGVAMEPVKSNQQISARSEIPIGKACSSLTSAEIIKFLTGDFRLSKARSNDLFWEAVWPRLLARGWHSEQPKDNGIAGTKHSLVFLLPSVKKFSRRRLLKGKHYFDSVSDVLSKVASDPGLLEIEVEENKDVQDKEHQDGSPNKQRQRYLQPRNNSNGSCYVQKFTIVDTSLAYGAGRRKVRELRSLPVETTSISTSSSLSSESEDTSEDEEVEGTITSKPQEDLIERRTSTESSDCVNSLLNTTVPHALIPTIPTEEVHENQSANVVVDKQQQKTMKYQFHRKLKSDRPKNSVPMIKQHDPSSACDHEDSSHSTKTVPMDRKASEDELNCTSSSPDAHKDVFNVSQTHNSSERSNEGRVGEICADEEASLGKRQSPKLIDLNVPHVSPDFAVDEDIMVDQMQTDDNSSMNKSSFPSEGSQQGEEPKLCDATAPQEQQPAMNSRRQSTRNRPLTTKALEALELGLLSTGMKRKSDETKEKNSRSSRRVRARMGVKSTSNDGSGSDVADSRTMKLDGYHDDSNVHMIGESQV